MKTKYYKTN